LSYHLIIFNKKIYAELTRKKLKKYKLILFFIVFVSIILIINDLSYNQYEYHGKQIHEGGFYLGKILSSSKKNFDKIKNIEFKNLEKFITQNRLSKNGNRFVIYTLRTEKKIQSIIAVPVTDCPKLNLYPKMVCNYFPKQDVIGLSYNGHMINRDQAWEILDNKLLKENKKIFNAPFEVLWYGPTETVDSTEWITGIYYPIR
tara:strand:+ start:9067 stop:9672 length:606 start_codon:yes stop_codon:yes gene_type:complete